MDTISESESEKIAKQQIEEVDRIILKANIGKNTSKVIRSMLLSPSLNEIEKRAIKTILLRNISSMFSTEEVKMVEDYLDLNSKAKEAKAENDSASTNFSQGGESGSYKSKSEVIELHFKWIGKAVDTCNMLASKLGIKKK